MSIDPYGTNRVYDVNQNLVMDDENKGKSQPQEIIRSFQRFIREFQLGTTYIYRYFIY